MNGADFFGFPVADWLPDYIEHVEARMNFAYPLPDGLVWSVDAVQRLAD